MFVKRFERPIQGGKGTRQILFIFLFLLFDYHFHPNMTIVVDWMLDIKNQPVDHASENDGQW